jgi:Uma2 family endonuclease
MIGTQLPSVETPGIQIRDDPPPIFWRLRRRFTVEDYYCLAEIGMIGPDERTELLDGEVVFQMPINSPHAGCVKRLNRILGRQLQDRAILGVQDPVRLSRYSEPQPDISILHPRDDSYGRSHPEPPDVFALIEVADSSLDLDRQVKVPLYAEAGIAEVWLVDLVNAAVEVYREPDARGYRSVLRHERGTSLGLATFPDVVLTVDEILGPPYQSSS